MNNKKTLQSSINLIEKDEVIRDEIVAKIRDSTKEEMDECTNAAYNAFNFETKTHKDTSIEAKLYLSKQDVYDIFKVKI